MTNRHQSHARREAGFTLVELLVAMVLVLIVAGGALTAFSSALKATDTIKLKLEMSDQMRIALDLMVRDFIQVGQGLPTNGRTIPVPSGGAATAIRRPSPPTLAYTHPLGTTQFTAVTAGDGLGPIVNGINTDIVTLLYADTLPCPDPCADPFAAADVTIGADGSTAVVAAARPVFNVSDAVSAGDLVMFTNSLGSAIQLVTVNPTSQTLTFSTNDLMNLNQRTPPSGTIMQLDPNPANGTNTFAATATRIRMVTYYIDNTTDPNVPRLVRQVNMNPGRVVAFGVETLQFSYDLIDGATNPTNVANPATPNQIRKVNIVIGVRSSDRSDQTDDFFRETMTTQVSFRSLALVDRYQ